MNKPNIIAYLKTSSSSQHRSAQVELTYCPDEGFSFNGFPDEDPELIAGLIQAITDPQYIAKRRLKPGMSDFTCELLDSENNVIPRDKIRERLGLPTELKVWTCQEPALSAAMKTNKTIEYWADAGAGPYVKIPAGLRVVPASNLPKGSSPRFWLDELTPEMEANPVIESWHRNYGFLIEAEDVTL